MRLLKNRFVYTVLFVVVADAQDGSTIKNVATDQHIEAVHRKYAKTE